MSVLRRDNIKTNLKELTSKDDVFKYISELAVDDGIVKKSKNAYNAIWERENTSNTGFNDGIAIPHGKSKKIKEAQIYIVKTDPIDWGKTLDGGYIDTIICLMIPENGDINHLKNLSIIAGKLMYEEYVYILKGDDVDKIYEETLKGLI